MVMQWAVNPSDESSILFLSAKYGRDSVMVTCEIVALEPPVQFWTLPQNNSM